MGEIRGGEIVSPISKIQGGGIFSDMDGHLQVGRKSHLVDSSTYREILQLVLCRGIFGTDPFGEKKGGNRVHSTQQFSNKITTEQTEQKSPSPEEKYIMIAAYRVLCNRRQQ